MLGGVLMVLIPLFFVYEAAREIRTLSSRTETKEPS